MHHKEKWITPLFVCQRTDGQKGGPFSRNSLRVVDFLEYASLARPVKELAGFGRVSLKLGEKKRVRFTFSPSQLAFLDAEMRWKIEKGTVTLEIGASSADVRLSSSFAVSRDRWIAGHDRSFYADFFVE